MCFNQPLRHCACKCTVESKPDLNSGGPREGGCVEGFRDDTSLSRIGAIGVPRRVGEDSGWGREESFNLIHISNNHIRERGKVADSQRNDDAAEC